VNAVPPPLRAVRVNGSPAGTPVYPACGVNTIAVPLLRVPWL
jgi:hypothetical protein